MSYLRSASTGHGDCSSAGQLVPLADGACARRVCWRDGRCGRGVAAGSHLAHSRKCAKPERDLKELPKCQPGMRLLLPRALRAGIVSSNAPMLN
eukprot:scaffold8826_cov117-Isochrysis_galbana.AAC.8